MPSVHSYLSHQSGGMGGYCTLTRLSETVHADMFLNIKLLRSQKVSPKLKILIIQTKT